MKKKQEPSKINYRDIYINETLRTLHGLPIGSFEQFDMDLDQYHVRLKITIPSDLWFKADINRPF